jgi:IS66 C-terminal element
LTRASYLPQCPHGNVVTPPLILRCFAAFRASECRWTRHRPEFRTYQVLSRRRASPRHSGQDPLHRYEFRWSWSNPLAAHANDSQRVKAQELLSQWASVGQRPARLNALDPEAYLRYVLSRIGEHPIKDIEELLPWKVAGRLVQTYSKPHSSARVRKLPIADLHLPQHLRLHGTWSDRDRLHGTRRRRCHRLETTGNPGHASPPQRRNLQKTARPLDLAIASATIDDVYGDEVKAPQNWEHTRPIVPT